MASIFGNPIQASNVSQFMPKQDVLAPIQDFVKNKQQEKIREQERLDKLAQQKFLNDMAKSNQGMAKDRLDMAKAAEGRAKSKYDTEEAERKALEELYSKLGSTTKKELVSPATEAVTKKEETKDSKAARKEAYDKQVAMSEDYLKAYEKGALDNPIFEEGKEVQVPVSTVGGKTAIREVRVPNPVGPTVVKYVDHKGSTVGPLDRLFGDYQIVKGDDGYKTIKEPPRKRERTAEEQEVLGRSILDSMKFDAMPDKKYDELVVTPAKGAEYKTVADKKVVSQMKDEILKAPISTIEKKRLLDMIESPTTSDEKSRLKNMKTAIEIENLMKKGGQSAAKANKKADAEIAKIIGQSGNPEDIKEQYRDYKGSAVEFLNELYMKGAGNMEDTSWTDFGKKDINF